MRGDKSQGSPSPRSSMSWRWQGDLRCDPRRPQDGAGQGVRQGLAGHALTYVGVGAMAGEFCRKASARFQEPPGVQGVVHTGRGAACSTPVPCLACLCSFGCCSIVSLLINQ